MNQSTNFRPVKTETGSSEPAGHFTSKGKSYNQRRKAKNKSRNNAGGLPTSATKPKFIGRETELKDHVFVMGANSCMMFSRTKKELMIFFKKKNSSIVRSILQGSLYIKPSPVVPQVANPDYDPTDITMCQLPPLMDKPKLSPTESITFNVHMTNHIKSARLLQLDMEWAFACVQEQCSEDMITKLEEYDTYTQVNASNNLIAILDMIQQICWRNYQNDEMPIVSK